MKKIITEGKAQIEVDTADIVSKDLEVFYNPEMILNRDLSIALLQAYASKPLCIALPLAGSGVRAARFAVEIPALIKKLSVNDMNPQATKLIRENLKRNNIDETHQEFEVHMSEQDACLFLEDSTGFDYIDVDPFGSPNQFLDTAIRKLSKNGVLAVTATDTAALAGTYPTTCKRKYWATSSVTPLKHETGLRILARKVMLLGLHHNKALIPLFSYHEKHYYRIFFQCVKSKSQAANLLDELSSYVLYDTKTGSYQVSKIIDETKLCSGPLYTGPLHNKEVLEKMQQYNESKKISLAVQELDLTGSYDTHEISQKNKLELINLDTLMQSLQEKGFEASRCATNLHAIKTTATFEELLRVMKSSQ